MDNPDKQIDQLANSLIHALQKISNKSSEQPHENLSLQEKQLECLSRKENGWKRSALMAAYQIKKSTYHNWINEAKKHRESGGEVKSIDPLWSWRYSKAEKDPPEKTAWAVDYLRVMGLESTTTEQMENAWQISKVLNVTTGRPFTYAEISVFVRYTDMAGRDTQKPEQYLKPIIDYLIDRFLIVQPWSGFSYGDSLEQEIVHIIEDLMHADCFELGRSTPSEGNNKKLHRVIRLLMDMIVDFQNANYLQKATENPETFLSVDPPFVDFHIEVVKRLLVGDSEANYDVDDQDHQDLNSDYWWGLPTTDYGLYSGDGDSSRNVQYMVQEIENYWNDHTKIHKEQIEPLFEWARARVGTLLETQQ